jgi:glycosyltransferase involved in cell wall biosynthesis
MEAEEKAVFEGIETFHYPESLRPDTLASHRQANNKLSNWIRRRRIDAVLSFSLRPAVRVASAVPEGLVPMGWMCQQSFPLFLPPMAKMKEFFGVRALLQQQTKVVCISEEQKRMFVKLGFPDESLILIRNGIDYEFFAQAEASVEEKKNERVRHGLSPDAFTIACVARLDPIKNHEGLLRGLKHAVDQGVDAQVVCVGDEPKGSEEYTAFLERMAIEFGVADRVLWAGGQRDVRPFLRMADAAILPSVKEAAGLVLAEAGAAGLALIGSNVGGIPDIVRNGRTGMLVNPYSPESFSAAFSALAGDRDYTRTLGENARKLVKQEFNRVNQDQKWLQYLGELCDSTERVAC